MRILRVCRAVVLHAHVPENSASMATCWSLMDCGISHAMKTLPCIVGDVQSAYMIVMEIRRNIIIMIIVIIMIRSDLPASIHARMFTLELEVWMKLRNWKRCIPCSSYFIITGA